MLTFMKSSKFCKIILFYLQTDYYSNYINSHKNKFNIEHVVSVKNFAPYKIQDLQIYLFKQPLFSILNPIMMYILCFLFRFQFIK